MCFIRNSNEKKPMTICFGSSLFSWRCLVLKFLGFSLQYETGMHWTQKGCSWLLSLKQTKKRVRVRVRYMEDLVPYTHVHPTLQFQLPKKCVFKGFACCVQGCGPQCTPDQDLWLCPSSVDWRLWLSWGNHSTCLLWGKLDSCCLFKTLLTKILKPWSVFGGYM